MRIKAPCLRTQLAWLADLNWGPHGRESKVLSTEPRQLLMKNTVGPTYSLHVKITEFWRPLWILGTKQKLLTRWCWTCMRQEYLEMWGLLKPHALESCMSHTLKCFPKLFQNAFVRRSRNRGEGKEICCRELLRLYLNCNGDCMTGLQSRLFGCPLLHALCQAALGWGSKVVTKCNTWHTDTDYNIVQCTPSVARERETEIEKRGERAAAENLYCLFVSFFFKQGSHFSIYYYSSKGPVDGVSAGVPPHQVFTLFLIYVMGSLTCKGCVSPLHRISVLRPIREMVCFQLHQPFPINGENMKAHQDDHPLENYH